MKITFNPLIAAPLLAAVAIVGPWFYRRFLAVDLDPHPQLTVRLRDFEKLAKALSATGKDPSWASIAAPIRDGEDATEGAYLQFSMESGTLGVDWVLESQTNVADQRRFSEIAEQLGHSIQKREMNDVRYLRVEDGNLPRLACAVFERLYGVKDRAAL